ncbi:MAG: hypothetical protein JSR91_05100 [Proteobacteria bacterium]|nr:hypothetical protein [Pseudomonadota bacterium]
MITPRQASLLAFVRDYTARHDGVAPTYREIMVGLDMQSKSQVRWLIDRLVQRGYMRRLRYRARAIEVIDLPGSAVSALRAAAARLIEQRGPAATAAFLAELAQDVAPLSAPAPVPGSNPVPAEERR